MWHKSTPLLQCRALVRLISAQSLCRAATWVRLSVYVKHQTTTTRLLTQLLTQDVPTWPRAAPNGKQQSGSL